MKKIKLKNKDSLLIRHWLVCLLFIANCQLAKSQIQINLQASLDTAIKNNLTVKNEKLRSEYQKKMIKTSASIPQTNVIGQYGQINSAYYDNSFGVTQSFNFPTVYSNQKKILTEEWKTSVLNSALKEVETKKLVRQLFYGYLYLKQKEALLYNNDSIYASFLNKANLRFTSGESNVLEKITAETQRGNIAIQLNQLQKDLELILLQFRLVLNTTTAFVPYEQNIKYTGEIARDSNLVNQHPLLKIMEQQKKVSFLNQRLEKSKLLPDLNFGYYNMSMKGTGSDDITYTYSTRFQALQVGVGIPLFFGSQKAKINAAKINQSISENLFLQEKTNLQLEYKSAINQYLMHLKTTNYFETVALKNASQILETANKQYLNGELNYLEWVMLTNQAISIKSDYLDAVKNLNESIIQINYLITK